MLQLRRKSIVSVQLVVLSIMMLNSNIHLPSFIELSKDLHTSDYTIQLAFIINPFIAALTSVGYGFLSDRYGRKRILLISIFTFLIGTIICAFSFTAGLFFLGRLCQSLGDSGIAVITVVVMGCYYQGPIYAQLQAILSMIMSSAWALAPILGAYGLQQFGWRSNFVLIAVILLSSSLPLLFWRKEELRMCNFPPYSSNTPFQDLRSLLQDKKFLTLTLGHAIPIGIFAAFEINSPLIFIKYYGYSPPDYSLIHFTMVAVNIISSLVYIYLVSRIKITITAVIGGLFFLLYMGLCSFLILSPSMNSILLTRAIFSMLALTTPFIVPTFTTKILELYPTQLGLSYALITLVRNIATTLISFLASSFSEGTPYTVFLITFLPAMVALFFIGVGLRRIGSL